jgi:integrase
VHCCRLSCRGYCFLPSNDFNDIEFLHGTTVTLYRRGGIWWYSFSFAGRRIQESSRTSLKTLAKLAVERRRRQLQEGFLDVKAERTERINTVKNLAKEYLNSYTIRHPASTPRYMKYCVKHIISHLGSQMTIDLNDRDVIAYQNKRLQEGASGKSINEEVGTLLRLLGNRGDMTRIALRRTKTLKLAQNDEIGKALTPDQEARLLQAAQQSRFPLIYCAVMIALNTGMRDGEIRTLRFSQLNLDKCILVVGKSKTKAGTGRTIPLNKPVTEALIDYLKWYGDHVVCPSPDLCIFPFGRARHWNPMRPITTFKTAWANLKKRAGVNARFHDLRHTCGTKLAESGAGDETIMAIMGHVSRRMLTHYSHIRTEHKRTALNVIASRAQHTAEICVRRDE